MTKLILIALPAAALLAGCATSLTPEYDKRFGQAVRDARTAQTINPTPSTPVAQGLDGKAARQTMDRYEQSFRAPPPVINVISVGGAAAGGTGSSSTGTSSGSTPR